jgi:hypothetical protein
VARSHFGIHRYAVAGRSAAIGRVIGVAAFARDQFGQQGVDALHFSPPSSHREGRIQRAAGRRFPDEMSRRLAVLGDHALQPVVQGAQCPHLGAVRLAHLLDLAAMGTADLGEFILERRDPVGQSGRQPLPLRQHGDVAFRIALAALGQPGEEARDDRAKDGAERGP